MESAYPFSKFFGGMAKVYTLSDKKGNVFYVGVTFLEIKNRLSQHISEATAEKNPGYNKRKSQHIRKLKFKVLCTIVEMKWVTGKSIYDASFHAREMESEWIRNMKEGGHTLLQGSSNPKNPDFVGKTIKVTELNS